MSLGLYSLSKRIEALGGSIGISDRTDGHQGSKFWFSFPYRSDIEASMEAMSELSMSLNSVENCENNENGDNNGSENMSVFSNLNNNFSNFIETIKPIRILVIDDSIAVLKVTSRLLQMNGHIIDTSINGSIGLKMMKEDYYLDKYDMVLCDLQMPVMDGIEATKRFRKFEDEENELNNNNNNDMSNNSILINDNDSSNIDSNDNTKNTISKNTSSKNNSNNTSSKNNNNNRNKRLLIIGMSANSDDQSKEDALNSGMDYFLAKPFSYQDLRPILLRNYRL